MRYLLAFVMVSMLAVTIVLATGERRADGPGTEAAPAGSPVVEPTATPIAATPTQTPTPTPDPTVRVTIAFSGEVLSHGPVIDQAARYATGTRTHDYTPMFRLVRPIFESVDLAICHVETPIAPGDDDLSGYPVFNAPRDLAASLADAGYGGCSTASNHSFDRGVDGVVSTIDRLEEAGLGWSGMARSRREHLRPVLYEVGGVTVGHLSYTYGLNGFVLPADAPWLVNVTETDRVLADAAAARAAGADIVVLSIQWGAEYQVDPTELQQQQAETFLASPDIDLIIGAHVHVVQPVDVIEGEYVVYGLGNFLSNQSAECCPDASQNGIIAVAEITGTGDDGYTVSDLSFVPTRVDRSDYTIVPLPQAVADRDLDAATRAGYREAMVDTRRVVNRLGAGVRIYDPGVEISVS